MIKLKKILIEKENPYGDVLFGDKDDPIQLRGMQGTMQPEPDTEEERKLFKHLEDWYVEAYSGFDSYAKELLSLKKYYPKILDPQAEGKVKILTRIGKLSLHFIDIIKHLNKHAGDIKFEILFNENGYDHKVFMLTLDAEYNYKMLGDKLASSWSSGANYLLQGKFSYGNQVTYMARATPSILKKCVMNPIASEVITKTKGNSGGEYEIIYVGKSIDVTTIQVPMYLVSNLPNDFTFGDRNHFNNRCLINRYVDKEYKDLIDVIDNVINLNAAEKREAVNK